MIKRKNIFDKVLILIMLVPFYKVSGQCSFIQADKFSNIWVASGNEVICFNKELNRIGSYSNILLGNPTYIDVLDPFRVVVFYQNSQAIVLLNNNVAEISRPIQFRDTGINDAYLVCRSNKGGFWVFNRNRWEILYFDSGFNQTGEKIIPDIKFSKAQPIFIQENKGILYFTFKDIGICRFDSFGAQMGYIPIKIDSYFNIVNNSLIFLYKGNLFEYSIDSTAIKPLNLGCSCIPAIALDKFYVYKDSELVVCNL